jgi:hypothetical protein
MIARNDASDTSLLARGMNHQVPLKTDPRDLSVELRKDVVYVLPITSILKRLPVVRAGDTGNIQYSYRDGCRNGAHSFNHDLARVDSNAVAVDTCPVYFVDSWAMSWSELGPVTHEIEQI